MPRDVEAAPEGVYHAILGQEAQRGQGAVVSDARMPVLDREVPHAVIDNAERHEQAGNQLETAAEMVDIVGLGQGNERTDCDGRRTLLDGCQRGAVGGRQSAGQGVDPPGKHVRRESRPEARRCSQEAGVSMGLLGSDASQR